MTLDAVGPDHVACGPATPVPPPLVGFGPVRAGPVPCRVTKV